MSSRGIRVIPDLLRLTAFGAIGGVYTAIGAVYTNPIRILSIKNATNQDIFISYDGVNNHEYLPAASGLVLDFCANAAGGATFPFIAAGTTIYIKDNGVAPTSGVVAVSAYYCIGD
jgi:hypothetical protein